MKNGADMLPLSPGRFRLYLQICLVMNRFGKGSQRATEKPRVTASWSLAAWLLQHHKHQRAQKRAPEPLLRLRSLSARMALKANGRLRSNSALRRYP